MHGPSARTVACASVAALSAWNNLLGATAVHRRRYVLLNAVASAGVLSGALASGYRPAELGLDRRALGAGVRWGGVSALSIAAGYAFLLAPPAGRRLLRDERVRRLDGRQRWHLALVRVPLGTVLWEEIAFRGVLDAVLSRAWPGRRADVVSTLAFAAWHVRPAVETLAVNGIGRRPASSAHGRHLAAAPAVVLSGLAGTGLGLLRRRSGSLVAPVMAHLAANSLGVVASVLADRPAGGVGRR